MICNLQSCPFWNTEECNYSHPSECDLAKIFSPLKQEADPQPPLFIKFSYRNEWRHIPLEEIYPIRSLDDVWLAIDVFRERHESQGELVVFATYDLINWCVCGKIPANGTKGNS